MLHGDGELETLLATTSPKLKGATRARPVDDVPPPLVLIELRSPKRGECLVTSVSCTNPRNDMGLGEKGAVDYERSVVQGKDGLLCPYIY